MAAAVPAHVPAVPPARAARGLTFRAAAAPPCLHRAYQDIGGLVTGDALIALLRENCSQPISLLARWIVERRVVSLDAGGQRWLPLFQFDPDTLRPRRGVEAVICEFCGVYDDTELAQWFATPSPWLDDARPAALMARDPTAVLEAARADRFVAVG